MHKVQCVAVRINKEEESIHKIIKINLEAFVTEQQRTESRRRVLDKEKRR
jgi:hypothetical protein